MVGRRIGRLTVIERADTHPQYGVRWLCSCVCGATCVVAGSALRSKRKRSCGCLAKDTARERQLTAPTGFTARLTHGQTGTPTWRSWSSMRLRCNNPNATGFERYGGRGIKVCARWSKFENFLADMGKRPSLKYSIDRVDNEGNYEPSNCRWATALTQSNNTRKGATV